MRAIPSLIALLGMAFTAHASTLLELTVDQMIQQSTAIVHAKVSGSHTGARGRDIYTYYDLQILETLKAASGAQSSVAVPGGTSAGFRQRVGGAPDLSPGGEYVVFLWTSRSGLTQIIGLSQGLFSVMQNSGGDAVLVRPAITELMVDASGHVINSQAVTVNLSDLRSRIKQLLGGGK